MELDMWLDADEPPPVIRFKDGSCYPASRVEVALFAQLRAAQAEVTRLQGERDRFHGDYWARARDWMARALDAEWEVARLKASSEKPPACRGCGAELTPECAWVADGCVCNSPRGINHGLVPRRTCTCVACDPEQTGGTRAP